MPLVFKISNLCGPDPPTLLTNRQKDDMQSQYRAMHYSASCSKNSPIHRESKKGRHYTLVHIFAKY